MKALPFAIEQWRDLRAKQGQSFISRMALAPGDGSITLFEFSNDERQQAYFESVEEATLAILNNKIQWRVQKSQRPDRRSHKESE